MNHLSLLKICKEEAGDNDQAGEGIRRYKAASENMVFLLGSHQLDTFAGIKWRVEAFFNQMKWGDFE